MVEMGDLIAKVGHNNTDRWLWRSVAFVLWMAVDKGYVTFVVQMGSS